MFDRNRTEMEELTSVAVLCWHDHHEIGADFITFPPGPFIHIKHFPFANQVNYTQVGTLHPF